MKQSAPTNMFHPVDFVIPTGPIFNYTSGWLVISWIVDYTEYDDRLYKFVIVLMME